MRISQFTDWLIYARNYAQGLIQQSFPLYVHGGKCGCCSACVGHVHICMQMHVKVWNQDRASLLKGFQPLLWERVSLNLKLIHLARLAGRFQGSPILQHLLQPKVRFPAHTACLAFVYMVSGDLNLEVLMLATDTSPAEPSHRPQYKAFYHVSESSIISTLLYFYVPF